MKPSPSTFSNEEMQDGLAAVPNFRARKQRAVREIIWDAAIDLFVEKGFDDTTVDEVAQAAGISQRSFFRYFATKGDLMAYGLVTYSNQLIAAIDACPANYSPGEVFRETVFQVAQEAVAHPRTRKILEILQRSPAAAAAETSRLAEAQVLVAKAFARRFSNNSDDELTAGIMAGVTLQVTGVTIRWCFEQCQSDVAAAMERILTTFERMFCTCGCNKTVGANTRPYDAKS
jgi:AcrR family transcriptional regulator